MSDWNTNFDGMRNYIQKQVKKLSERTVDIGELSGKIAELVNSLKEDEEPIFLTSDGKIIGIIISPNADAGYSVLAESVENMLIAKEIQERAKSYDPEKNIDWENIKENYGL